MKNKIKNKILVILFILISFLNINSNVFAGSGQNCSKTGCDFVLPFSSDFNPVGHGNGIDKHLAGVVIVKQNDITYAIGYYYYADTHLEHKFYISSNNIPVSSGIYNTDILVYSNDQWIYEGWSNADLTNNGYNKLHGAELIYTTSNIYTDNTYTDVFFYRPPATLEEIMEQEMKQKATIQEIVGILPIVMITMVSLLALRKALRMLLTLLRHS